MKIRFCTAILIFAVFEIAQAKDIRGQVAEPSGEAIEFANISVFAGDSIVGGCITDSSGLFTISLPDTADRLHVSSIGYEDKDLPLLSYDVGIIELSPVVAVLKGVSVEAPLIRREADRIIVNIAADPRSENKDAQEILKTAPGVWATDESISIYGQGGTTVYIDDRKVNLSGSRLMGYLKTIQSSSIATIEIVPNAGAEYNADSGGGVIRINLRRKRVDGLEGAAGLNATAGKYKQWLNPYMNISLHSGKWTLNLNGNVNKSISDRYRAYEDTKYIGMSEEMKGMSEHKTGSIQGNVSIGLFGEVTGQDRMGLQLDYVPEKSRHNTDSESKIFSHAERDITYGRYFSKDSYQNFSAAYNWTHNVGDNGTVVKLISNYNYQKSSVNENNEMRRISLGNDSIYRTYGFSRYHIFTTDLTLYHPLNSEWNLNTGAKYTYNGVRSISTHQSLKDFEWLPDEDADSDMSYNENIAALFATVQGKIGRWSVKGGLRGEYYKAGGREAKKYNWSLFPNANVSYDITEKGDYTVSFGYHRYIGRPTFRSLNPVVRQISDYSYTVGNPNLVASYTDGVSLDFILSGKFIVSAGYSITDKPIRQMFLSEAAHPERMYLTWDNAGVDRNMYVHGDGSFSVTKWLSFYSSVTYVLVSQRFKDAKDYDSFGYVRVVGSMTFSLPKEFNLSLNCFYNSEMKIGNITVYPILNITPTLQKRIGSHWSVSASVENMLQRKNRLRISSSGYDRVNRSRNYASAKINVTYRFNSGKSFSKRRIEKNGDNSRLSRD